MKLKQYLNEGVMADVMEAWRKSLRGGKLQYIENDVVSKDIGMETIRFSFPNNNVDPKWFAKTYLKSIKYNIALGQVFVFGVK